MQQSAATIAFPCEDRVGRQLRPHIVEHRGIALGNHRCQQSREDGAIPVEIRLQDRAFRQTDGMMC